MWTSTQSDKMFGLQQHSSVRSIEGEYFPLQYSWQTTETKLGAST